MIRLRAARTSSASARQARLRADRTRACRAETQNIRCAKAGFTLTELLVANAIILAVMAAIFGLVRLAQGTFQVQVEAADMQQRLRVGIEALRRHLLVAEAVLPYRVGREDSDPEVGVFYRPDVITLIPPAETEPESESHTYFLRRDIAMRSSQLMHYDGEHTSLPVVDHVVALEFQYFGVGQERLDPARLQDGPWYPDATDEDRYDSDLLAIRRVTVTLRVQAALASMRGPAGVLFVHGGTSTSAERYLPDLKVQFDVSPRNVGS